MFDIFFFVGLPYIALAVMFIGLAIRFLRHRFSITTRSSQMLEDRAIVFGSVPWHIGILTLLFGHLLPLLIPGLWAQLTAHRAFVLTVEAVGFGAGLLALVGIGVLLLRRLFVARIRAISGPLDWVVLSLLLGQVGLGLLVANGYRWASVWSVGTLVPYLWSLLTLTPEMELVSQMPVLIKAHVIGAWLLFALVPFSRLVHAFVWPLAIVVSGPQRVVWGSIRHSSGIAERTSRR
jgi:respiratory nitrate reductase gamma subunit